MRHAFLAIILATLATAGQTPSGAPKWYLSDIAPGRIAWFDLTTSDLPRSKRFYEQLLGWQFAPVQGTDLAAEIVAGGMGIGTLRVAEGKSSPFNGVVYVHVSDVQASCAKVKDLGGTVAPGFPFDLPDGTGAIGLILDPTGHPLGLYARTLIKPRG